MSDVMVIVVTGANRGIGLSICELLQQGSRHVKLYAASRAGSAIGLKTTNPNLTLVHPKLDVTKQDSITALAESIRAADGKVDVLINNAGVCDLAHGTSGAQTTLDVNLRGTVAMCQTFLPLMAPGGRIVNVSSVASMLDVYSPEIQERMKAVESPRDAYALEKDYLDALESDTVEQKGWRVTGKKGVNAYLVSKALLNAMTIAFAKENPNLLINCCCPGWVDTDMGRLVGSPAKTTAEGAKIPVKLAIGDIGDTTGKYWANPSIKATQDGQVMAW